MKTALIFAAGRGERLKPFTYHTPKALCPIQDIPLIEHHVINLKKAGFERLLINHAYLGDQIRRHLGRGSRFNVEIIYLPEPPGGLETAGTIIQALPYFNQEPFLTVNADIFTHFNFSSIREFNLTQLAHLVLVPKQNSHRGDFGLSTSKIVTNDCKIYTYSGIGCYHPRAFTHHQLQRFSVTPLLRQWASQNQITGELYDGLWFDIGTPERLEHVKKQLATTRPF